MVFSLSRGATIVEPSRRSKFETSRYGR